jgi:hypothetical protein
MADSRFGGVGPSEWSRAVAYVHFAINPMRTTWVDAHRLLEVGTHGVAIVDPTREPVIILPEVAREGLLDAPGLIEVLRRKARDHGYDGSPRHAVLFQVETVCSHETNRAGRPDDAAAAWLARHLAKRTFQMDLKTGGCTTTGPMVHGRRAVALRAIDEHGGFPTLVTRARRALARDVAAALRGQEPEGWPEEPAMIAGTLALCALAGVASRDALAALAKKHEVAANPWHAAQVALALGEDAPAPLWRACTRALDNEPWAPWTLMAARRRGDTSAVEKCVHAVLGSVRREAPHRGGSSRTALPELALTALAAESLVDLSSREARRARREMRAFLSRWQIRGPGHAAVHADAVGAFPLSPIHDALRIDVTGHALRALIGS